MRTTGRWGAAWTLATLVTLVVACSSGNDVVDAMTSPDAADDLAFVDAPDDAAIDTDGPSPLCVCPAVPAGGTCRSCSALDNGCETRNGQPWAVRCSLARGCVEAEDCSLGGPAPSCEAGVCASTPVAEPEPDVVEVVEPDVVEVVEPGSRQVGEACQDTADCANAMTCVSGQYTQAHCNPMCTTTQDCLDAAPGASGQCQAIGGYQVCVWMCGAYGGGATCPGDLDCDGAFCG